MQAYCNAYWKLGLRWLYQQHHENHKSHNSLRYHLILNTEYVYQEITSWKYLHSFVVAFYHCSSGNNKCICNWERSLYWLTCSLKSNIKSFFLLVCTNVTGPLQHVLVHNINRIYSSSSPTVRWYIPTVQQVGEVVDELAEGEADAPSPLHHSAKAVLSHPPDCGGLLEDGSLWGESPTCCSVLGLGCCGSLGVILPQQQRSEPACLTSNTNGKGVLENITLYSAIHLLWLLLLLLLLHV